LRGTRCLYFAGQITGAEGYVEAAACGAMTGIHAARAILGVPAIEFPRETAFGTVVAHLQNRHTADFQPSNVTWGSFDGACPERSRGTQDDKGSARLGKRERRRMMAERALVAIEKFASETVMAPVG
jgi:methylenetetrahydrofolate--tRNA-(uracil-5-)-methyltransferase